MAKQSVWNITDDPRTGHEPRSMMVMGTNLKPGQRVQVGEDRLARAHKVRKDEAAGLLFIGPRPPAAYLQMKVPPRVKLDEKIGRAHGRAPITAVAAEAIERTEKLENKTEEKSTETLPNSSYGSSRSKNKGRRGGSSSEG